MREIGEDNLQVSFSDVRLNTYGNIIILEFHEVDSFLTFCYRSQNKLFSVKTPAT